MERKILLEHDHVAGINNFHEVYSSASMVDICGESISTMTHFIVEGVKNQDSHGREKWCAKSCFGSFKPKPSKAPSAQWLGTWNPQSLKKIMSFNIGTHSSFINWK
jgi:hypothetical protein